MNGAFQMIFKVVEGSWVIIKEMLKKTCFNLLRLAWHLRGFVSCFKDDIDVAIRSWKMAKGS